MKRKALSLLLLIIFILFAGCGSTGDPENPMQNPTSSNETGSAYTATFGGLSIPNDRIVELFLVGDIAVFQFIQGGMDSIDCDIVTYSLTDDAVCGTVSLGTGMFAVSPLADGFCVAETCTKAVSYYSTDCTLKKTFSLPADQAEEIFAVASADGRYILSQNGMQSTPVLYDTQSKQSAPVVLPQKWYTGAYFKDDAFYLTGSGLAKVEPAKAKSTVLSDSIRTKCIGSEYAADFVGDYIILQSLSGDTPSMFSVPNGAGDALGAYKDIFGFRQISDGSSALCICDIKSESYREITLSGQLLDYCILSVNQALVVTADGEGGVAKASLTDISVSAEKPISICEYDDELANGYLWPSLTAEENGSEKTLDKLAQIEQDYGVRIYYSSDPFGIDGLGYTITPASEQLATPLLAAIENCFATFYPKGLLREAGGKYPLVLVLCEDIYSDIAGVFVSIGNCNVCYVETSHRESEFLSIMNHEICHALNSNISPEKLSKWESIMPQDVQSVYGTGNGLLYTVGTNDPSDIWFYREYGCTNSEEDRATVFEGLYQCWADGVKGEFVYPNLQKKAEFLSSVYRETFHSLKDIERLAWETVYK